MSDFKNFLRDVGYFGVGAAAAIIEAGGKAVKALVNKGADTLKNNQDTVDELKRKAQELGGKVKDTVEKAVKSAAPQVDASKLTPEERAELRRQLEEADAAPAAECDCADACDCADECDCTDKRDCADACDCTDKCDCADVPEATYREETKPKPEEPVNG